MSIEKEKKGANVAFLRETLNYILKTIELC